MPVSSLLAPTDGEDRSGAREWLRRDHTERNDQELRRTRERKNPSRSGSRGFPISTNDRQRTGELTGGVQSSYEQRRRRRYEAESGKEDEARETQEGMAHARPRSERNGKAADEVGNRRGGAVYPLVSEVYRIGGSERDGRGVVRSQDAEHLQGHVAEDRAESATGPHEERAGLPDGKADGQSEGVSVVPSEDQEVASAATLGPGQRLPSVPSKTKPSQHNTRRETVPKLYPTEYSGHFAIPRTGEISRPFGKAMIPKPPMGWNSW